MFSATGLLHWIEVSHVNVLYNYTMNYYNALVWGMNAPYLMHTIAEFGELDKVTFCQLNAKLV